jgi:hypothetical protein
VTDALLRHRASPDAGERGAETIAERPLLRLMRKSEWAQRGSIRTPDICFRVTRFLKREDSWRRGQTHFRHFRKHPRHYSAARSGLRWRLGSFGTDMLRSIRPCSVVRLNGALLPHHPIRAWSTSSTNLRKSTCSAWCPLRVESSGTSEASPSISSRASTSSLSDRGARDFG